MKTITVTIEYSGSIFLTDMDVAEWAKTSFPNSTFYVEELIPCEGGLHVRKESNGDEFAFCPDCGVRL